VLGAFFLILWLGLGLLFSLSWGGGELGSTKNDSVGAYEDFSAAAPLVLRVVTATVDPPMDPATPSDRFKSIGVYVTLPDGLSIAAKRLDGAHLADLRNTGGGRFFDAFPSDCLTAKCARTYVLVACWADPTAEGGRSIFMGAEIIASPAGTSPSSVSMSPSLDLLPHDMAVDLAKATGCEGRA
jgi:hypothetical protein